MNSFTAHRLLATRSSTIAGVLILVAVAVISLAYWHSERRLWSPLAGRKALGSELYDVYILLDPSDDLTLTWDHPDENSSFLGVAMVLVDQRFEDHIAGIPMRIEESAAIEIAETNWFVEESFERVIETPARAKSIAVAFDEFVNAERVVPGWQGSPPNGTVHELTNWRHPLLVIPGIWTLGAGLFVLAIVVQRGCLVPRFRLAAHGMGRCWQCGYSPGTDLAKCPECGTDFKLEFGL